MIFWLVAVVVALVVWAALWQRQPKMAFGVLIGLPVAWLFSRLIAPYVTGAEQIPAWLPPLPLAIIAVTLFVFGVLTWFKGPPSMPPHDEDPGH